MARVACRRTGDVAERLKAPACYEGTGPTVVGGKRFPVCGARLVRGALVACRLFGDVAERLKAPAC